jgi:hypothetical protein
VIKKSSLKSLPSLSSPINYVPPPPYEKEYIYTYDRNPPDENNSL